MGLSVWRESPLTMAEARERYREFWQLTILDRRDGQILCYCCDEPAGGRSSMNIWGTICDFPTCFDCHKNYDGNRADSIPRKRSD